jgi:hypothetical protein
MAPNFIGCDAPVCVDGDEAVGVGGDAVGGAAAQPRQDEDAVDLETSARGAHDDGAGWPWLDLGPPAW